MASSFYLLITTLAVGLFFGGYIVMERITSISLCMIVKNEEVFLDAALKSARSVLGLGDMIVVDTGSTDRTKDIAMANGANVYDFEWCDDFSAARNFSADKAKNDWVLALDADEEITKADIAELEALTKDIHAVGTILAIEMTDKSSFPISRLYNRKKYRFDGIIHEQLVPIGDHQKVLRDSSVHIAHFGYDQEFKKAKGKFERNEGLLLKALAVDPYDPYMLYQLGKCYSDDKRNLLKACELFERALSLTSDFDCGYVYNMIECYGYALLNTEQYEKALNLRNVFAKQYEGIPQFRFLSAHIFQNSGMLIEAVECYESCLGADVVDYKGITSYLSYYNMGVILECVGMVDDAIEMYKNCGDYDYALKRLAELT